jgi:hypothetical protein
MAKRKNKVSGDRTRFQQEKTHTILSTKSKKSGAPHVRNINEFAAGQFPKQPKAANNA